MIFIVAVKKRWSGTGGLLFKIRVESCNWLDTPLDGATLPKNREDESNEQHCHLAVSLCGKEYMQHCLDCY